MCAGTGLTSMRSMAMWWFMFRAGPRWFSPEQALRLIPSRRVVRC